MASRQMSDALFLAIAHPSRRVILETLLERSEVAAADLGHRVALPAPAVSQHLRVLLDARLIADRREGRRRYYRLTPEPLLEVVAWMQGFERAWRDHPDRLADFLTRQATAGVTPAPTATGTQRPSPTEEHPWI